MTNARIGICESFNKNAVVEFVTVDKNGYLGYLGGLLYTYYTNNEIVGELFKNNWHNLGRTTNRTNNLYDKDNSVAHDGTTPSETTLGKYYKSAKSFNGYTYIYVNEIEQWFVFLKDAKKFVPIKNLKEGQMFEGDRMFHYTKSEALLSIYGEAYNNKYEEMFVAHYNFENPTEQSLKSLAEAFVDYSEMSSYEDGNWVCLSYVKTNNFGQPLAMELNRKK